MVCGGEDRTCDYQIWDPWYLTGGLYRPENITVQDAFGNPISQDLPSQIGYSATTFNAFWTNTPGVGVSVDKVVLMRPSSLTHHDDAGQRYIELTVDVGPTPGLSIKFKGPPSRNVVPPGWYMLFLATNQGVPSNAFWVNIQ
jgi:hypothetical protein